MLIELVDSSKTVIITTEDKGKKKDRIVNADDLVSSIIAAVGESEVSATITPLSEERKGVKLIQTKVYSNNSRVYVLHLSKSFQPMPVYNRFYANTGIPSLLFAVKVVNNRLQYLYVVAVKDKEIKMNTELFMYPYSNVNEMGGVCLGSNKFTPGIEDNNYKLLYEVPFQFISMANSSAEHGGIKNNMKLSTEELVRNYQNIEFDDNLLMNSPYKTYSNFIKVAGGKM